MNLKNLVLKCGKRLYIFSIFFFFSNSLLVGKSPSLEKNYTKISFVKDVFIEITLEGYLPVSHNGDSGKYNLALKVDLSKKDNLGRMHILSFYLNEQDIIFLKNYEFEKGSFEIGNIHISSFGDKRIVEIRNSFAKNVFSSRLFSEADYRIFIAKLKTIIQDKERLSKEWDALVEALLK